MKHLPVILAILFLAGAGCDGGMPPSSGPVVSSINPTSGSTTGSTNVTVTGSMFAGGASLTIGGVAATNVNVSGSTSLTATTGPRSTPGRVDVVVQNPDGRSGSLVSGFEYLAAVQSPTVSSINPTSGLTTGGTSVTVTGANFVNGASLALGGVAATNVNVSSSTSLTATTGARSTPGRVDVVVQNPDGRNGSLASGFEYLVPTLRANPGGPYSVESRRDVTMDGLSGSTAGQFPIAFYRWNCGQTPPTIHLRSCNQVNPTPTFRYEREEVLNGPPRTYTVTLEVEDTMGNKNVATTTVTVRQTY